MGLGLGSVNGGDLIIGLRKGIRGLRLVPVTWRTPFPKPCTRTGCIKEALSGPSAVASE